MSKQYYGGQAVIEGVMMRGRKSMAVAVRNPQGEIVLHEETLTAKIYTSKWGQWPFVRGLALLWDALDWACAPCCGAPMWRCRKTVTKSR
ncbi:MAG: hypothetical protein R2856_06335 [Caldilineaceae bacterium]